MLETGRKCILFATFATCFKHFLCFFLIVVVFYDNKYSCKNKSFLNDVLFV